MQTEPATLLEFIRKEITPTEQAAMTKKLRQYGWLPQPAQVAVAAKFMMSSSSLIDLVNELRAERGYKPLKDDSSFVAAWDAIDAAIKSQDSRSVMRGCIIENIKLTHERNVHLRALGRPEMPTYRY